MTQGRLESIGAVLQMRFKRLAVLLVVGPMDPNAGWDVVHHPAPSVLHLNQCARRGDSKGVIHVALEHGLQPRRVRAHTIVAVRAELVYVGAHVCLPVVASRCADLGYKYNYTKPDVNPEKQKSEKR